LSGTFLIGDCGRASFVFCETANSAQWLHWTHGIGRTSTQRISVTYDLEIFFLSDTRSSHCRNLSRNPSMAMTIFRTNQPWDAPGHGLQLFGTCSQTEGQLARKAERVYAKRFPLYGRWMSSTKKDEKKLAEQLRSYRFYRFLPRQLKVLDEAEYGGATFVMVTIRRRNPASKTQ